MRTEQHDPFVAQLLPHKVEIQQVIERVAHAVLVRIVTPRWCVKQHALPFRHAQRIAQPCANGFVASRANEGIVSRVALLDDHAPALLQRQPERIRQMLRRVRRWRKQVSPLPCIHSEALGKLVSGVQSAFHLDLHVVPQALQGGAVPTLDVHLVVFRVHVFRQPVVHDDAARAS